MKRLNSNVSSTKSALKERPEILDTLSMNVSVNVPLQMISYQMGIVLRQSHVTRKLISHYPAAGDYSLTDNFLHLCSGALSDNICPDFPATLQHAHDCGFRRVFPDGSHSLTTRLVHVPRFSADESLINLNLATGTAKFATLLVLKAKTNAMQHEPCRFLSYADGPCDLVRTN